MDDLYLIKHLKKLSELLYNGKPISIMDPNNGMFIFGTRKNQNIVTRKIAIYLCTGITNEKSKDKKTGKDTDKKIKRTRSF
jgi:hypothetical protein